MTFEQHSLLRSLTEQTTRFLQSEIIPVSLSLGDVLFEPGQMLDQIWFVQSGLVSLVTLLQDGHEIDGIMVGRHGALGLPASLGSGRVISRAVVQVEGQAWLMSGAACRQLMQRDQGFSQRVMCYYEAVFAAAVQLTACNVSHSLEQRLCRWLLTCQDQLGSDLLPIRQEVVSRMLGANRTSIASISRLLQDEATILVRHGRIKILSTERLSRRACECYAVTHERFRLIG